MIDVNKLLNLYSPEKVDKFFESEMPNANITATVINVAIFVVVVTIASLIGGVLSTVISGVLSGNVGSAVMQGGVNFIVSIGSAIFSFIMFFIGAALLYFIATKVFGGTGKLEQLLYLMSVSSLALSPVFAVLNILSAIPCVNCLAGLGSLIAAIYMLFLDYKALMISQKMLSDKALFSIVAWIVVIIIIAGIIAGILMVLGFAAMFMGVMGGTAMAGNAMPQLPF